MFVAYPSTCAAAPAASPYDPYRPAYPSALEDPLAAETAHGETVMAVAFVASAAFAAVGTVAETEPFCLASPATAGTWGLFACTRSFAVANRLLASDTLGTPGLA